MHLCTSASEGDGSNKVRRPQQREKTPKGDGFGRRRIQNDTAPSRMRRLQREMTPEEEDSRRSRFQRSNNEGNRQLEDLMHPCLHPVQLDWTVTETWLLICLYVLCLTHVGFFAWRQGKFRVCPIKREVYVEILRANGLHCYKSSGARTTGTSTCKRECLAMAYVLWRSG